MDVKNNYTKDIERWLQKEIEVVFPWLGVPFLEVSVFFEKKERENKLIEIALQPQSFYLTIVVYPKFKRIWRQKQQKTLKKALLLELAKVPVWDLVSLVQHPFRTFEEFEQVEERTASLINFYTLSLIDLKNLKFPKLPQVRDRNSLKRWIEKIVEFLTPIMPLPKIKLTYQFFEIDDKEGDVYYDFDSKTQKLTLRLYPYFIKNWKEGNSDYLVSTLTHELAHLHTHELSDILYSPKEKKQIAGIKRELVKTIFYFLQKLYKQPVKPIRFLKASL